MLRIDSLFATFFGSFFAILGIVLSIYSKYVSNAKTEDADYEALCDISESISCSKAFTSEYGFGFGQVQHIFGKDSPLNISNSVLGIGFYGAQLVVIMKNRRVWNIVVFWMGVLSMIMSTYLAYVLTFILHDLCIVCVSTYVVNLVLLVFHYLRMRSSNAKRSKKMS